MKLTLDQVLGGILAIVAFVVFANSLSGSFVYDDRRQIVMNPLIQDNSLAAKALVSDVWAFKGDGNITASNYWRPTFTAWCILNFRLFGLQPFGWHFLNILLHVGVCLLAFFLLRRWNVGPWIAAAIVCVFAVHPVHTESVAWIAGSPDLLFTLFLLLALYFADVSTERNRTRNLVIAIVCYLFALGSKEVAVLCAPMFLLILGDRSGAFFSTRAWKTAGIFLVAAISYAVARASVLGRVWSPVADAPDLASAALTAPSIFFFYLRQIVAPFELGPNYHLRPVGSPGFENFVVPLAIGLMLLAGLVYAARNSFVRRVGLALFLLPLVPAFLITAFPYDQIVHDRYLYLPLLGFLIVVIDFAAARRAYKSDVAIAFACGVIAVLLSVQTITYNSVWLNDLSLWKHAVSIDNSSASNWLQLGSELELNNDNRGAAEAYDRSLSIRKDPLALTGRGRVAMALGETDAAIGLLNTVIAMPLDRVNAYSLYQAYEALGVAYQQKRDFQTAEEKLREGRDKLPIYRAAFTEMIAVTLYSQGRKAEALAELEAARQRARTEMLPSSKSVFFRLGLLYAELGRKDEARSAMEEYLNATRNAGQVALAQRRQASDVLRNLK
ncbi:MAG TPA: tetratricopeptide repeat protein [Pyrinomonadaceae bacterium]|nr:tetratricopeptide repeat protein [Pyrinomonadaceae bacterium]